MKRPLSPTPLVENGLSGASSDLGNVSEPHPASSEQRAKREKKHQTYTLCEVCNIQLNSPAQAQIHYNGKSHQKRLKQINKGKPASSQGSPVQSSPLLATLPVPGRSLQPQLDLKHFLPFRLNGSSPLSLFPNFSSMDPVQKAVINHTFGVPQPLKKKQIISCNICHLRFNSTNQAEAHYKGHKHTRKLKAIEAQKHKQMTPGAVVSAARKRGRERASGPLPALLEPLPALLDTSLHEESESLQDCVEEEKVEEEKCSLRMLTPVSEVSSLELPHTTSPLVSPASELSESISEGSVTSPIDPFEEGGTETKPGGDSPTEVGDKDPKKIKQHLHCPVCKVTVNSTLQLDAHNSGAKHKSMLEGQGSQPRRRGKVLLPRSACKTKRIGNKGSMGIQNKAFHCEVCEIYVNSDTQLKQHMNSRRHKDRLAGKPPKPKYSPHSKSQPNSVLANVRWGSYAGGAVSAMKKVFGRCNLTSLSSQGKSTPNFLDISTTDPLAAVDRVWYQLLKQSSLGRARGPLDPLHTKLALQKQLSKTLATSFLPSPLSPAALCTMAANPLALRHPAGTATLIQTPLLGPALFRPAPGPLRAAHTPFMFAPY
ncbi:zinc finger protein 385C-like isoform X1 [Acipenser oxyrinchus oxyrinchus]|uniref:Zinc finger protein 385C-like isoform X1 n=1 Tax=Acipenser oxyrinchus oxyrinchus TaxID=40147 RepID=A0AAD8G243_ACIOX|nr:zinc finger protein 385C-like isoform X1 [Acipenser oxyrinchus oxyrinchus]